MPKDWHSAKFEFLPRARAQHSAKKPFFLKKIFLKIVFAEWYHLALGKIDLFAECQAVALGKTGEVAVFAAFFSSFAECHTPGTRQRLLCPVLALGKAGKFAIFFVCCFPSKANTQNSYIIHETAHRHLASHKTHT